MILPTYFLLSTQPNHTHPTKKKKKKKRQHFKDDTASWPVARSYTSRHCVHKDDQLTGTREDSDSITYIGFIFFLRDTLLIYLGAGSAWDRFRKPNFKTNYIYVLLLKSCRKIRLYECKWRLSGHKTNDLLTNLDNSNILSLNGIYVLCCSDISWNQHANQLAPVLHGSLKDKEGSLYYWIWLWGHCGIVVLVSLKSMGNRWGNSLKPDKSTPSDF